MNATIQGGVLVSMRGLRKSYGAMPPVVKNLDLDIRRGEFLTLLGPSGSGKTTTLMMLAGFQDATAGEILIEGHPVSKVPPHRRGIGMVFQSYALFPHMTVGENLAFPLEVRGMGRAEIADRVARALDMVELGNFSKRKPAQLSGGQQQRVALARALIFEPRLVLMDEPLGALDKHLREQMQYEIKSIHGRLGVTVVYVTHDQSEALTMSDRIAVFNDGAIQQIASPQDIYKRPTSPFVASFIGENNALPGVVECLGKGNAHVRLDSGQVVEAEAGLGLQTGDRAVVCIRPESLSLGRQEAALNGEVTDIIYHGDHLRLHVLAGDALPVVVKLSPAGIPDGLAPGSAVSLAFQPADARALRADQPRAT